MKPIGPVSASPRNYRRTLFHCTGLLTARRRAAASHAIKSLRTAACMTASGHDWADSRVGRRCASAATQRLRFWFRELAHTGLFAPTFWQRPSTVIFLPGTIDSYFRRRLNRWRLAATAASGKCTNGIKRTAAPAARGRDGVRILFGLVCQW